MNRIHVLQSRIHIVQNNSDTETPCLRFSLKNNMQALKILLNRIVQELTAGHSNKTKKQTGISIK